MSFLVMAGRDFERGRKLIARKRRKRAATAKQWGDCGCCGIRAEGAGTSGCRIPRHYIRELEKPLLSPKASVNIWSDLVLGGDGRTRTKIGQIRCRGCWIKCFSNGWVTPLQSSVESPFQQLCSISEKTKHRMPLFAGYIDSIMIDTK